MTMMELIADGYGFEDAAVLLQRRPDRNSRGRRHLSQQRLNEDVLDFCHRLAKLGCRPQTIAGHTGLPLESVEYVLIRNGYPQGDNL